MASSDEVEEEEEKKEEKEEGRDESKLVKQKPVLSPLLLDSKT